MALLLLSIETNEPTMSIDYNDVVIPGDTVVFNITVENTTVNQCNDCIIYIDTISMDNETLAHIKNIGSPIALPSTFESESIINAELMLELGSDTPNGVYYIPIVFEGTLGNCDGGCFPFRISHTYGITVTRNVPEIAYECNRVCDVIGGLNAELPLRFTNNGTGDANNVKISLYGSIDGYISPDNFDVMEPNEQYFTTVYINTSELSPGFYDLGVNFVYYDDYFKLYSSKITFRIQVRPQRPQMEISILTDGRNLLIDLKNEGGLKAKDVTLELAIDGEKMIEEEIDVINSTGSVLLPVSLPSSVDGEVSLSAYVTYYNTEGEVYTDNSEMFLYIPKDSSGNDNIYYYLVAGALIICIFLIWVKRR
ncbi:MAG: hypothetical protein JW825_00235 [Candidatus Methanofastidiosa archaeon]|nr:hypothetical protein [Candidatus Methanofastidiosa archaeon]